MNLLFNNVIIKKFTLSKKSSGGRNFTGLTTVHHRFLGHKKRYRVVDFFRIIKDVVGRVRKLEYDPNRSAYLALICYKNGVLSYMLAFENIKINDFLVNSKKAMYAKGNSTILENAPIGSFIFNLEYFPNFGGKIARAAGSFCQVLKRIRNDYVLVKLRSKELRLFNKNVFVTYGIVSNKDEKFVKLYKAGQSFYRGFRPVVRGEAKNPVDHPHGGNTSGGRHPLTPWGKLTKGSRTRNKRKNTSDFIYKFRYIKS